MRPPLRRYIPQGKAGSTPAARRTRRGAVVVHRRLAVDPIRSTAPSSLALIAWTRPALNGHFRVLTVLAIRPAGDQHSYPMLMCDLGALTPCGRRTCRR